MDENKIKFKRNIIAVGDSLAITIPKELLEYLNLSVGSKIAMIPDKSSKGKFIAFWNEG